MPPEPNMPFGHRDFVLICTMDKDVAKSPRTPTPLLRHRFVPSPETLPNTDHPLLAVPFGCHEAHHLRESFISISTAFISHALCPDFPIWLLLFYFRLIAASSDLTPDFISSHHLTDHMTL